MTKVRIQKYLSNEGILSRRKAEAYIQKGWISVNGEVVTEQGRKIDPTVDRITLDPKAKKEKEEAVTLLFHKPRGIMTNCPQKGEKEIVDLLPKHLKHVHSIGRLDKDSEGLILMTSDGTLANYYLNAGHQHERVYKVWLANPLNKAQITELENGVIIDGVKTQACKIKLLTPTHIQMTLIEGRNRQIRKMAQAVNNTVTRLKRIQFAEYKLGNLKPGMFKIVQ